MAKLVHNIQKKQHRERSQISSRSKFGLLEKKKDYKLRADDYHKKEAQLKILKEKAKYANEDEYFHAMVNKKTNKDGILVDNSELGETLNHDQIRLLKSQDLNYVNVVTSRESKLVEKAMNNVGVFKASGNHTVFVDGDNEFKNFSAEKHFNTTKELVNKRENRLKVSQLLDEGTQVDELSIEDRILRKKLELEELRDRIDRENKLKAVRQKLVMQKEMMKDAPMKKIKNKDGKTSYKWMTIRKR